MKESLSFGNHKGAVRNPIFLKKFIKKMLSMVIYLIPGALLAPMNIMTQNTINEHGRIV